MDKIIFLLVSTIILGGCTIGRDVQVSALKVDTIEPKISKTGKYSHNYSYKINTNYMLREVIKTNIGAAMIKVEDAVVEDIETDILKNMVTDISESLRFKTLYDIEINGVFKTRKFSTPSLTTYKYVAGTTFKLLGDLNIEGKDYHVIQMDDSNYKFLVTKQGELIKDKFLDIDKGSDDKHYHYTDIEMKTVPHEIKFSLVRDENKKSEKEHNKQTIVNKNRYSPVINYELIYGGKDSSGLHIVYREYTGEGMARQAFFQNLNYENKARTIRFKNTNIEIINADSEQIAFRVIEDDIFDLEKKGIEALPKNFTREIKTDEN